MPDFKLQPSFPIASVIDAAQRNNQLQQQALQYNQGALLQGLQSIGQLGESLFNQKVRMAQALAGAKMYAQTPEGQQMLGTNAVAASPSGASVTQNQTAAYDPSSGSVTPNQSPVGLQDIATSMLGMAPKDVFENQVQQRAARTQQGELALKQATEPQKIAIEGRKAAAEEESARMQRLIQGLLANATIKNQQAERAQAAENAALDANKETAKHFILHPLAAYKANQAIAAAGEGSPTSTSLPEVGKTIVHPSGVKITRTK